MQAGRVLPPMLHMELQVSPGSWQLYHTTWRQSPQNPTLTFTGVRSYEFLRDTLMEHPVRRMPATRDVGSQIISVQ
jgi:hypothetical protein